VAQGRTSGINYVENSKGFIINFADGLLAQNPVYLSRLAFHNRFKYKPSQEVLWHISVSIASR